MSTGNQQPMLQKHSSPKGFSLKNGIYGFPKNVSVATWVTIIKRQRVGNSSKFLR